MNKLFLWFNYIVNRSNDHLLTKRMTYSQHLILAMCSGLRCLQIALILMIHGIIPAVYHKTGSNMIRDLDGRLRSLSEAKE